MTMAACGYAARLLALLVAENNTTHALNQSQSRQILPVAAGKGRPG